MAPRQVCCNQQKLEVQIGEAGTDVGAPVEERQATLYDIWGIMGRME